MKTPKPIPLNLPVPSPAFDGIDHLNVHYKHSQTKLGKILSPYFVAKFTHPYFGPFKCIEGLMLYLRTGCRDDNFRVMTGSEAKHYFREQWKDSRLLTRDLPQEVEILMEAYYARLKQYPVTEVLFKESTLPLDNYYLWGEGKVPIRPANAAILIEALTRLRDMMRVSAMPTPHPAAFYEQLRKS